MNSAGEAASIVPVGVFGFLVRFSTVLSEAANAAALAFRADVEARPIEGVLETSPSLVSVFFRIDPVACNPAQIRAELENRLAQRDWFAGAVARRRLWHIPCCFDGPQLAEAAALAGVSEGQAIAEIEAAETRVLTLGFAPGQPYLGTLAHHWNIPRMAGVAPQVPRGALVVAVRQLIVFANQAPTGWRHIGNTALQCFDARREMAFAFEPGDFVRIHAVPARDIEALKQGADTLGGARLEVLS